MSSIKLHVTTEKYPYAVPFRIAGYSFDAHEVAVVTLESDGLVGRGEAAGVYYKGDTPSGIAAQVEALRPVIETGLARDALQRLLPPGGARNALDCALWELDAKRAGCAAWQLAGLAPPRPLTTTFTCGAGAPAEMASAAVAFAAAKAIKLKLIGDSHDIERVRAVRHARPDVWLGIDANQGLTPATLATLLPTLLDCGVKLIEQPFPIGNDAWLDGMERPIPIAADESVQSLADIASLVGRFDVVNIKLDKSGGLTEALAMLQAARAHGLDTMVGCMSGTSLAIAPAFLVGQSCSIVDLDGPALLANDRAPAVVYDDGLVRCAPASWGGEAR